jgi:hypothetical protein
MDRVQRHQIELALRAGGDGGKLDLGVAGAAAIVEAMGAAAAPRIHHPVEA